MHPLIHPRRLKRARKKFGRKKSRTRRRAAGDKVITDQFQTVGVVLASDWCQKNFVFFLPNHRAARPGVVSRLLTPYIHLGQLLAMFTRGGKFQSQHQMEERSFGISASNSPQIRWTFRRYHSISVFNRLRVFVHSPMSMNFSQLRKIFAAFLDKNGFFSKYFLPYITCCD